MRVIIEGPDCTGKTTLANYLLDNEYCTKYFHSSSTTKNDFEYHDSLLNNEDSVFDRFHLGEFIFPVIFGRDAKMHYGDFNYLMKRIMMSDDIILVILYASDINLLKERLIARGDNDLTKANIESINNMFRLFATLLHETIGVLTVDVCKTNPIDALNEYLKETQIK